MSKIKIAGAWAGVVEVELETWTLTRLKEEVARNCGCGPNSVNLICSGKVLRDSGAGAGESLAQLGVKNNAKIMAVKLCSAEEGSQVVAEEERSKRLARVKAAAEAISRRHADASLPLEDQMIELEDQSGRKVNLGSDSDRQAIMMGLMLHTDAKQLIVKGKYKDALEVLAMAEEAFNLCDPKLLEFIDNPPILQIDMVWCYFMLQDLSWLSVAGERLDRARRDIERCHGKDSFRVKLLQGGRQPELALHLRLELLEGVIAYHSARYDKSRKALTAAREKLSMLQVPDEALSLVMSMGFGENESKRALRMSNQVVGSAVDFLVEQKALRDQKHAEYLQQKKDIKEQKKYGKTPLKKPVDLQRLTELVSIGFEKDLAAEALRRNENDTQKALDDLTNPEINSSIQLTIESRKRKRQQKETDASIDELVRMGFERSRVVEAFQAGGTMEEVLQQLLSQSNPGDGANNNALTSDSVAANDVASSSANEEGPSTESVAEQRDFEMEDELADELANVDALTDYDIDVTREGEAIHEYLALLDSAGK